MPSDKTQQEPLEKYFDDDEELFDFSKTDPVKVDGKDDKKDDKPKDEKPKDDKNKKDGDDKDDDDKDDKDDKDLKDDPFKDFDGVDRKKEGNKEGKKDEGNKDKNKKGDETGDTDGDNEEDDVKFYTSLAHSLKEKGVLSIEIDKDAEIDEDAFFELQDKELEQRVDETIDDFFKGLDNDAKQFIKYKKDGGATNKFLQVYSQPTFKPDLDLTVDTNKHKVIKTYLREIEGLDEEEIDERFEFLKDAARVDKYAKKYHTFFIEKEAHDKKQLLERQAAAKQKAVDDAAEFKKAMIEVLKKDEVAGIPISSKERGKLTDFIISASVKTKGGYRTPFQIRLDKALDNDEETAALAKILMNDFKLPEIEKKGEQKKVHSIRERLEQSKEKKIPSSARVEQAKTLADLIG